MSESARIVAEIAERLDELESIKKYSAGDLVARLNAVNATVPRAFPVLISLLRGNTEAVCCSFNVMAHSRGLTKQAIHFEWVQMLEALDTHFPSLAGAIRDVRHMALASEDQLSHADAMRATREASGAESLP
ncbi:MAG: hypothetical protein JNJ82_15405 [Opitutaceae bacterium]|nr:hypothetical protein [Opitutaceae bacterium]